MARWALLWACAVAVASGLPVNAATPDAPVTNIVLVGAYGNLVNLSSGQTILMLLGDVAMERACLDV